MELIAPTQWACIDFISDLHLHPHDRTTFAAWCSYLQCTRADALFILGDLFEVWIGDDAIAVPQSFEAECAQQLACAAQRMPVFVMHGNRDFLMGQVLMRSVEATLLDDPTVLVVGGTRWMLSHGDAWCLADTDYQRFRKQVRTVDWQHALLAKPLTERQAIAADLRSQSEARKHAIDAVYTDLDTHAVLTALQQRGAAHLIHGHTHRPTCHAVDSQHQRWVLSDWDASAYPPRLEVLRLRLHPTPKGDLVHTTLERINPTMA